MKFFVRLALVVALISPAASLLSPAAVKADAIRKLGNQRVSGTVKTVTGTEVTIDVAGSVQKVPVNEIEYVEFDGEPTELKNTRNLLKTGQDQKALEQLARIAPAALSRKELKQDYEFYAATAKARLALRGAGAISEAGTLMYTFVQNNADSYHYLPGQELLGELLVASGNTTAALAAFAELEKAPYDEYKMRAGVARGRALMTQKDFATALTVFEAVLALPFNPMTQKGTPSESQRFAAVLGRAQCMAGTGKTDDAIKQLETEVIPNLNPEESALQALAYVTLGNCYLAKSDGKKSALLAFLHVDVLYDNVPSAHAEALWNLSNLWVDIGKNERGQDCLTRLNRLYPGSPWLTKQRPS
jgi:tetratricopeptide (TPR) repeat protein